MTIEEGGHFSKDNELGKRSDSTFTFSNCRYVIKEKEILKGLSGTVKSGEVLAIVGPSGAGKTMLMNMFSLTPGPGKREGRVTLNSQDLNRRGPLICTLYASTASMLLFIINTGGKYRKIFFMEKCSG